MVSGGGIGSSATAKSMIACSSKMITADKKAQQAAEVDRPLHGSGGGVGLFILAPY
jgi:hypothetical protein